MGLQIGVCSTDVVDRDQHSVVCEINRRLYY